MRKKREPLAHAERFLLHAIERFLRALHRMRFVGEPFNSRRRSQFRKGKSALRFAQTELLLQLT